MSYPRHLALPNVPRRSQGLPAAAEDRHRPHLPESCPDHRLPLPLITHSAAATSYLRWIRANPWWGHDPSDKQLVALWGYEECPNLFYGGAAGPGKTSYLLMAAVQYVHHPHYRALILRKTYADLSLPGAIMDRAIDWWDGVEGASIQRSPIRRSHFPSGASITFGYLASVRDH